MLLAASGGAVARAGEAAAPVSPTAVAGDSRTGDVQARDWVAEDWREAFDDPDLMVLLTEALDRNLTIESARQRLQQAQALQGRTRNAERPGLDLLGAPLQDVATSDGYYQLGLGTRWEVDFFGANAARNQEAEARTAAQAAQLRAARLMIATSLIQAYYERHEAQMRLGLARQSHDLSLRALDLVRTRLDTGLADARELRAASVEENRRRIEQTRLQHQVESASRTMDALLSRPASAADDQTAGHFAAVRFPAELQADDLRRRPDVMAAEAEVLEAAARVRIARAALYPSLSLTGSISYTQSLSSAPSPGGLMPVIGPTIDIPLWDWGRRRALVNSEDHALSSALALYHQAVIEAAGEVQTGFSALEQQKAIVKARRETVKTLRRSLDAWTVRHDLGLASDLDMIQPQTELLEARSALADARLDSITALIRLFRSAGGPLPAEGATP
ncbi:Outer membrane protein OprM precursor [Brevundimonas sp. SH203]|uniref:TolC family protein n=1 Tax=Brevundimonas sp. SH203 TaxID=345167 RepID=UPI0009CD927C|nr:TolC family protein [Brevundimonas sp. SH203]GAW42271.1 Outer membrane protein OprM precursor [Brevundimonas sp. SH203]